MSERESFMTRLAQSRAGGLVDLKYFFNSSRPYKPEEIYAAMNEVEEAAKVGLRHSSWHGNEPAPNPQT